MQQMPSGMGSCDVGGLGFRVSQGLKRSQKFTKSIPPGSLQKCTIATPQNPTLIIKALLYVVCGSIQAFAAFFFVRCSAEPPLTRVLGRNFAWMGILDAFRVFKTA